MSGTDRLLYGFFELMTSRPAGRGPMNFMIVGTASNPHIFYGVQKRIYSRMEIKIFKTFFPKNMDVLKDMLRAN